MKRADLRLCQLISPALPVGGFTYSQGLEWAVHAHWVCDRSSFEHWLQGLLSHSLATLELPILLRLLQALDSDDKAAVIYWVKHLVASRETLELRKEERQRGAALAKLLPALGVVIPDPLATAIASTQLAGFALAAHHWAIAPAQLCGGYSWSWLENNVTAGVKLIPLGQTEGQQLLLHVADQIPAAVEAASHLADDAIGSSTSALAIASSRHENQYTRLFRS
ncbi:MAG: urease accessory protein UreF [Halioglobus sp.]|nr:urease accessory protein UreF [Halioglobus sp.]